MVDHDGETRNNREAEQSAGLENAASPVNQSVDREQPGRRRLFVRCALVASVVAALLVGAVGYSWWLESRVNRLITECRIAMSLGDSERLEQLATELRDRSPHSAAPWLFLANAAEKQGRLDDAIELLGHVPATAPQAADAYCERAKLQFGEANHVLDGVETCKKLLEINPRSPDGHTLLIAFYGMTFQRSALLAQIREAIRLQCEPRESYTYLIICDSLSFTNGIQLNDRWHQGYPDSEILHVAWAVHLAKHSKQSALGRSTPENQAMARESVFQIAEFAKRYPQNVALLEHRMGDAVDDGDIAEMGRLLSSVPTDQGGDHMLWRYQGWYHAVQGDLDNAEKAYRRSLSLHPLSWKTRFEYAGVLRRLGRKAECIEAETIAIVGKQIQQDVSQLVNMRDADDALLKRIGEYAKSCGDIAVSDALDRRLGAGTNASKKE